MLLYLDEFVPLLQAVPESPLAPLSVLPVVLQRSVHLLLLLLPQLLPSVSELSRQGGHRPTVTLLLTLVKKQNERLRFVVAVMWNFRVTNRRQLMAMISF